MQQRRRRGRQRCPRWVTDVPEVRFFKPAGVPLRTTEVVEMTVVELETLRLVDLEGLNQDEAALRMGVSRRTLWNDLMNARKKVAYALVNGLAIRIRGGAYSVVGDYSERDIGQLKTLNESMAPDRRKMSRREIMSKHKDCKNFRNRHCELKDKDVDPEAPACIQFEEKK
jgi:predicted DNA-binding protein (UPF0251 family)